MRSGHCVEHWRVVGQSLAVVTPVWPSRAFEKFARRSAAPGMVPALAQKQLKNPQSRHVTCNQVGGLPAPCAWRLDLPRGGRLTKAAFIPLGVPILGAGLPDRTPIGIRSVGLTDARAWVHGRIATSRRRGSRPLHGGDWWPTRRWSRGCFYGDACEHALNPRWRQTNTLGYLTSRQPFGCQRNDSSVPAIADGCRGHAYSLAVHLPYGSMFSFERGGMQLEAATTIYGATPSRPGWGWAPHRCAVAQPL